MKFTDDIDLGNKIIALGRCFADRDNFIIPSIIFKKTHYSDQYQTPCSQNLQVLNSIRQFNSYFVIAYNFITLKKCKLIHNM